MNVRLEFSGSDCSVVLEAHTAAEKAILEHICHFEGVCIHVDRARNPYASIPYASIGQSDVERVTLELLHKPSPVSQTTPVSQSDVIDSLAKHPVR